MSKEVFKCWAMEFSSRECPTTVEVDKAQISQQIGARAAASIYAEQLFRTYGEHVVKTLEVHVDDDCEYPPSLIYLQANREGKIRYIDVGVIDSAGSEWGYRVTVDGPPSAFFAGKSLR